MALPLSDPFCVERHREAFRDMIRDHVDLLFCNRAEVMSMWQTGDHESAMASAAAEVGILACTDGANGAHIFSEGQRWHAPAMPVQIVDATGAGDLFAGAFLYGVSQGLSAELSARGANFMSHKVISQVGARLHHGAQDFWKQATG